MEVLADAQLFQREDSILSGPAGGMVGAVQTGVAVLIRLSKNFDMGGGLLPM